MTHTAAAYDIADARTQLPILDEWNYLNTGTVGVMAEPVLRKHLDYIADHERGGHATQARAISGYERARQTLAALVNAEPSSIGLNRNATDGINWVAATYPLAEGDEVLTSTEEHPAMILPWVAACQRAGASMRYVDLSHDPDALVSSVTARLSRNTRIVAMSQVSCEKGTRVPVELLRDVVGDDVSILVDASQSVGQFPVDIPSLRANFVIGNGHKWLAGPKGTGFAWFNQQSLDLVQPVYFGDGTVAPRWSREYYQVDVPPPLMFTPGASRYEFGTRAWHMYEALADAIDYQGELGWDAIFSHVAAVSAFAKQALEEIPGVTVISPQRWDDSSGVVTFTIEDLKGVDVSAQLWNSYRIAQRSVELPSAVRISCTYFTTEDDVTRLAEAVDRIARGRS